MKVRDKVIYGVFVFLALQPIVVVFFTARQRALASSFSRFDHTQRRSTVCRTPLDEINPSQRPLLDNTQHSQQTNIHAHGGIRTHDLSRRAAVDLRLRPRGYWDRQSCDISNINQFFVDPCRRDFSSSSPSGITVIGELQPLPKLPCTVLDPATHISISSPPSSLELPQLTHVTSTQVSRRVLSCLSIVTFLQGFSSCILQSFPRHFSLPIFTNLLQKAYFT